MGVMDVYWAANIYFILFESNVNGEFVRKFST